MSKTHAFLERCLTKYVLYIFLSLFRCGSSAAFHEGALLPKGGGFPEFLEKRDSPSGTGEKGLYQHQAAEGAIVQEIKQQN